MDVIDGQNEIIEMLKNSSNGLTLEEIQVNEKFQPEISFVNGNLSKIGINLVGVLDQLINNGTLIWKQGKYYLNKSRG